MTSAYIRPVAWKPASAASVPDAVELAHRGAAVDNARPLSDHLERFPYSDAPRLPEGELLDPADLVTEGSGPIELEIGPGRGGFAIERLQAQPAVRLIGLEVRRKWATLVDRRIAQLGHGGRGRVFAEDVRVAGPRLQGGSFTRIYVHFPDPWWKKRHLKRLVVSPQFVAEAARLLRPAGELFVQTDVEERAEAYEQVVAEHAAFAPWSASSPRVDDHDFGARSPRERRAMQDGLPIYRLRFRRL